MSDPYIGEIKMFAGNYAPKGWALCNGQLLPIAQNTALFSILGVNYGGDGKTTFALPDLQGQFPLNAGAGPGLKPRSVGETGGSEVVALNPTQLAPHTHIPQCNNEAGTTNSAPNNVWSQARVGRQGQNAYAAAAGSQPNLNTQACSPAGGGQPHNNMPPYLAVNFIIAMTGIFPPRQ